MHEMSIAQNVIEIVEQQLRDSGPARARAVRLRIGEMAGVVPDSLEFCFTALTEQSPHLYGASLIIERIPVSARCKSCQHISQIEVPAFFCTSCESSDLELLSGMELQVVSIELDGDPGSTR
jgi:hydrogenase nickel incorporation protein HypA/HybF